MISPWTPKRRLVLATGAVWALAWLLTVTSMDRDIVIVPFYVEAAAGAEAYPQVRALPSWTRAAAQPDPAVLPGDSVVAVGGVPMQGAGVVRVVSHSWAAMGNDGRVEVELLRDGTPLAAQVAIPASIPKAPVVIVSGVFGALALLGALRFPHLLLAQLAFAPMMLTALWLGANFGRSPVELLVAFGLRAVALALMTPANLHFFRHFPDGDDRRVAWARGWPLLFAVQGLFFVDTEMFQALPALLSDLGPKLMTGVVVPLYLLVGTINYRAASPVGRRRFKWLMLGTYVALVPPTLVSVLSAFRPELGEYFLPSQLSLLAIPISIGISILRTDLLDIDRLLNAATVYLGFAAVSVLALTLGVPVWSDWAVRELQLAPETARTLFTAALLGGAVPVAIALRARLDAWVLADRRALESEVSALQAEIGAAEKLEEIATRLADRLPEIFGAEGAVVIADAGDEFAPVAGNPVAMAPAPLPASGDIVRTLLLCDGPVAPEVWREPPSGWDRDERALLDGTGRLLIPIRIAAGPRGRLAAFVALGPRSSGHDYEPADRAQLAAIAERAGAVLTALEHDDLLREARALNADLGRERDEVERVSQEKTTLLAAASHDLRQPLHALGLFLGALEDRVVDDDARRLLGSASDSARSLQQMFEALLDVTQLDAGVLEPQPRDGVAIGELFEEIERDFASLANRQGVRLKVRPTRAQVRSDPALLRSVLQNLIGNALRYTEEGGVLVGARRRGRDLRIEVWDTGRGIAPEEQRRIFEEWSRGEAPATSEGFGLGLTIARRLCRLLGHDLALRSEPGRGTVFSVTLPVSAAVAAEETPAAVDLHGFRGRSVWIVDDDHAGRAASRALLQSWGVEVLEFSSTEESTRRRVDIPPDAVFVAARLGGSVMGADELDSLFARWGAPVPICVVSADSDPELEALRAHGFQVLRKPVEPVRLRAALAHLLLRRS